MHYHSLSYISAIIRTELISKHYDESTLVSIQLKNLLLKNTIKTCSCYQYLLIIRNTPMHLLMDFVTELLIFIDWKSTSYHLMLAIIDQLMKIVYYELVQITINTPALAANYILLSSLHMSPTKKISAPISDSIRNLMTACRNNFLHKLNIASLFLPDLWGYVYRLSYW